MRKQRALRLGDPESAVDPARLPEYILNQDEVLLPVRERAQVLAAELLR